MTERMTLESLKDAAGEARRDDYRAAPAPLQESSMTGKALFKAALTRLKPDIRRIASERKEKWIKIADDTIRGGEVKLLHGRREPVNPDSFAKYIKQVSWSSHSSDALGLDEA